MIHDSSISVRHLCFWGSDLHCALCSTPCLAQLGSLQHGSTQGLIPFAAAAAGMQTRCISSLKLRPGAAVRLPGDLPNHTHYHAVIRSETQGRAPAAGPAGRPGHRLPRQQAPRQGQHPLRDMSAAGPGAPVTGPPYSRPPSLHTKRVASSPVQGDPDMVCPTSVQRSATGSRWGSASATCAECATLVKHGGMQSHHRGPARRQATWQVTARRWRAG